MTMQLPMKVPCQNVLIPSSVRLLRMTSMSAAPTTPPSAVPLPPIRLVPPMTVAAITREFLALAEILGDAAEPAGHQYAGDARHQRGEDIDAELHLAHRTPVRRAAFSLPPTAKTWQPQCVQRNRNPVISREHDQHDDRIGNAETSDLPPSHSSVSPSGAELVDASCCSETT